jgi:CheY-like chemotaxis protein
MLQRTIGLQVQIRLDLDEEDLRVLGDEVQLETAILNLALNARDAMPEGGVLTVRTRPLRLEGDPELPDDDYVELAVTDTGIGMAPEVVARAFDPFFTTKAVGKGTGLGLSQVYGAVRQAGGIVRLESRVGQGTTVKLLLRRTEDFATDTKRTENDDDRESRSARVLVVDDDPDVRRFLAESLDSLGFSVIEAEDGRTGLEALKRTDTDVMILDFAMPGLNGAEVAREAQAIRPELPIVFATGFAESAALEQVTTGDRPILRKPFRIAELRETLDQVLALRPSVPRS